MTIASAHSGGAVGPVDRLYDISRYEDFVLGGSSSSARWPRDTTAYYPPLPPFVFTSISAGGYASTPDGKYLALARNSTTSISALQVGNLATGSIINVEPPTNNVHVRACGFSPDGQTLVAAFESTNDAIRFYRVGTWERIHDNYLFSRTNFPYVRRISYSPTGSKIAAISTTATGYTSDAGLMVIDAVSFAVSAPPFDELLAGQSNAMFDCAWSPDGTKIGFARTATAFRAAASWVSASSLTAQSLPSFGDVLTTRTAYGCAFSPDGALFAVSHNVVSGYGSLTVYDTATNNFLNAPVPAINSVGNMGIAFSRDGKLLFCPNGSNLSIISTTTWQIIATVPWSNTTSYRMSVVSTPRYRFFKGVTTDIAGTGVDAEIEYYRRSDRSLVEVIQSSRHTGFKGKRLVPAFNSYGALAVSNYNGDSYTVVKGRVK